VTRTLLLLLFSSHLSAQQKIAKMVETASSVRQRKVEVNSSTTKSNGKIVDPAVIKREDHISLLDVFRSLAFLVLASCALSYFVTRESLFWNLARPKWTNVDVVKAWLVSLYVFLAIPQTKPAEI
jgi:hypothetical protein